MEHGRIQDRRAELSRDDQLFAVDDVIESHFHGHRTGRYGRHVFIGIGVDGRVQPVDSVFLESDGSLRVEPLVEAAHSGSPLPAASGFGFEDNFLAQCLGVLLLHHGIDVLFREVLVQIHVVTQVLEAGHTTQNEVVGLILQVQSGIQQVTLVAAGVVVGDATNVLRTVFFAFYLSGIFIRITSLVGVFVVHGEIKFQVVGGQVDGTDTSAEFIVGINPFAVEVILEEPTLMVVEQAYREGELAGNTVVVGERGVVVVVSGRSQAKVCALISEGRFGEHTDESAHGVASVERSLWSAHDVDTLDIRVVEVESRLVDERNVIDVETYCRCIDT